MWSDSRLIARARQFIPTADEVWRLQRGDDPECRFFQAMVAGRPGPLKGSHQGIYVCSPNGTLLSRVNSLDPDRVIAVLDDGLQRWETRRREEPTPGTSNPPRLAGAHRWEISRPREGLVLVTYNRDLPTGCPPDLDERRGNRDHAWFSRDEARAWLPADPRRGTTHRLPPRLAERLARFHLVDNVHGQTSPFASQEVSEAEIITSVTALDGSRVALAITGRTRCESDGVWEMGDNDWKHFPGRARGVRTDLFGEAEFDLARGVFRSFDLVGVGESWGGGALNGRDPGAGPFPIGFYLTVGGDAPGDRVAPAFIDVYNADWVARPRAASKGSSESDEGQ